MSSALMCDRCRSFFTPWDVRGNFGTIEEYKVQTSEQFVNHEVGYSEEQMHLCPKCTDDFDAFMFGNRKAEHQQQVEKRMRENEYLSGTRSATNPFKDPFKLFSM